MTSTMSEEKQATRKILCYDLHGADSEDYNDVYSYIEDELDGTRATESVYIFFSKEGNGKLRDTFVEKFGKDVSVLVNDFPQGAHWNKIEDSDNWIIK